MCEDFELDSGDGDFWIERGGEDSCALGVNLRDDHGDFWTERGGEALTVSPGFCAGSRSNGFRLSGKTFFNETACGSF